jgi:hypothetical protein
MRYLKICTKCGMKFSCTEHCKQKNDKCLCGGCDEAGKEWQMKCDKRYKIFNPSERINLNVFYCDYLKREITKLYCNKCANYYRETCPLAHEWKNQWVERKENPSIRIQE